MGLGGSGLRTSYMGKSNLSCLECKKITTLEPVYLVYWKKPDKNGYNTSDKRAEIMYSLNDNHRSYDKLCTCASCNAELIIKINSELTFCIQDIIGYERKHEESGIIYYEIIPYFLNKKEGLLTSFLFHVFIDLFLFSTQLMPHLLLRIHLLTFYSFFLSIYIFFLFSHRLLFFF